MLFILGFLVGAVTGGSVGIIITALLAASRRDDDE